MSREPESKKQHKKELSREARVLLEVLRIIDEKGYFDTNIPWEWIDWEEVEFKDDKDYIKFIHEEVPMEIKEVAKEIGAKAYAYHLGYDVPGADYIVQIERKGRKYTLYVVYSELDLEKGRFTLYIISGEKGWYEPSVYYHRVL
jgi:hypothetical protein